MSDCFKATKIMQLQNFNFTFILCLHTCMSCMKIVRLVSVLFSNMLIPNMHTCRHCLCKCQYFYMNIMTNMESPWKIKLMVPVNSGGTDGFACTLVVTRIFGDMIMFLHRHLVIVKNTLFLSTSIRRTSTTSAFRLAP